MKVYGDIGFYGDYGEGNFKMKFSSIWELAKIVFDILHSPNVGEYIFNVFSVDV